MPRGNDPSAADEFKGQYGVHGNAEGLIQENRLRHSQEVRSASLKSFDRNATLDLDTDDVESAAPHDNVVAHAVHGDRVVYVWEDERGDHHKGVLAYDKKGGKVSSLKDEDRVGAEEEQAAQERLAARQQVKEVAAKRNAEVRDKVEEARQKAEEQAKKDTARDLDKAQKSGSSSKS